MMVQIGFYDIFCNTCDWSLCWFDFNDPWEKNVTCPDHPGKKQVSGRNRDGDPTRYLHRTYQWGGEKENAYGAICITPDIINERGTAELWRAKRNL